MKWLHMRIYTAPFAIGAVAQFCSPWVSIPFAFIVGLDWIGAAIILLRRAA